ncbi:MAG: SRPBCC domain-containing protein [Flavobacteriales bacterium]|nr:SRPBCC domain-containing protein [Flavobacteriales bacterium]
MATKNKLHIEYFIKASPEMLYQYISTPSGLSEWFCDVASAKGQNYTFSWTGGGEENAKMIARRQDSLVRFRWEEDAGSSYYFEMSINQDELTGDVLLSVTDFVYKGDEDSAIQMWNASIQNLKTLLGA